jgi:hypothetical protein
MDYSSTHATLILLWIERGEERKPFEIFLFLCENVIHNALHVAVEENPRIP